MLQPAHELHGAGCRVDDLGGIALDRRRCFVGRDDEARVSGDGREQVVQVVRDRAEIGPVLVLPQGEQMCHVEFFGRTLTAL